MSTTSEPIPITSPPIVPDEIQCDECGVQYTDGDEHECLTCDKCGDEMHALKDCLGTADCCGLYANICNNCAHYDDEQGIVVCEDCEETAPEDGECDKCHNKLTGGDNNKWGKEHGDYETLCDMCYDIETEKDDE